MSTNSRPLPYTFADNRSNLIEQARQVWSDVSEINSEACPDNYAMASITMHPSFSESGDCPNLFLEQNILRLVGARPVECYPRKPAKANSDSAEQTITLIVVGKRQDFQAIANNLEKLDSKSELAEQIRKIESFEAVTVYDRTDLPHDYYEDFFLVGLYPQIDKTVIQSKNDFKAYAQSNNFLVHPSFLIEKVGIYYMLIKGERYNLDAIGDYAFVSTIKVPPSI